MAVVLAATLAVGVLIGFESAHGVRGPGWLRPPAGVDAVARGILRQVEATGWPQRVERYVASAAQSQAEYPHITPTPGKPVAVAVRHFTFDGFKCTVAAHADSAVYWGARSANRSASVLPGESAESWRAKYRRSIALDPKQSPLFDEVCGQLRAIRRKRHLDADQYLELIAKYVQSIPYDQASYERGAATVRFPVETIVDGKGLCEDKSLLLAALLSHEGYATALLCFGPENHMAVGVKGPGHTYGHSGYLFVETTGPSYVSDVPDSYIGGIRLTSEPVVVPIGSGKATYDGAAQVRRIVRARDTAQAAADKLVARVNSGRLSLADARSINRKLRLAESALTDLRSNVVDPNGRPVGHFLDRAQAFEWVRDNAWWL